MRTKLVLILFLLSWALHAQKLKHVVVDSTHVPKNIEFRGKLKSSIRWTDSSGDNMVVLSETGVHPSTPMFKNDDGKDAELYAYHYKLEEKNIKQTWRVYDFIKSCSYSVYAKFVKNTLQVTDLNRDGVGEVWLMFKTSCRDGVDGMEMKIVMYQGHEKFVMKGNTKVRTSDNQYSGGDYTFDEAFQKSPSSFRTFAQVLWEKNVKENFH